jgi:putative polysaccharide biosynthesis protein
MKDNLIRLRYFLKDSHKKPYHIIFKELLQLWILKKHFPYHYIGRLFYRKDAPINFKDYLSVQEYNQLVVSIASRNLKHPTISSIILDKLFFYFYCLEHKISTPKVISYNFRKSFFFNGQTFTIKSSSELVDYFLMVFKSANINSIFLKPTQGSQGFGIILLNEATIREQSSEVFEALINNSYIHQEVVIQHSEVSMIHNKSINSIRLETFIDNKDNIHFLGAYMRFGSGDSVVDNVSSGGFFVPVNIEEGKLFKKALTGMIKGARICDKHPDSGFVFEDFKIPHFNEALILVRHVASLFPGYIQGWDIAITENGPIIIEGNDSPAMLYSEFSYHGFKNKSVFKEIMKDTKEYHKTKYL